MASSDSRDQSLLNRLNALKPTSISLKTNTITHGVAAAATLPGAAPSTSTSTAHVPDSTSVGVEKKTLSREDALAERLRVLRNNSSSSSSSQPDTIKQASINYLSGGASSSAANLPTSSSSSSKTSDAQPPCSATPLLLRGSNIPKEQQQQSNASSQKIPSPSSDREDQPLPLRGATGAGERGIDDAKKPAAQEEEQDDDDYRRFLESLESGVDPDQTLDELLDGLGDEFYLEEDDDAPLTLSEFDPAREAKNISDLLEQFQKENNRNIVSGGGGGGVDGVPTNTTTTTTTAETDDGHAVTGRVSGGQPPRVPPERAGGRAGPDDGDENDNGNDDDSESEQMTREVEKILSQVRGELGVASGEDNLGENLPAAAGETGVPLSAPEPGHEVNDPARTSPTIQEGQQQPREEFVSSGSSNPTDAAATSSFSLPDAPASPLREITTKEEPKEEQGAGRRRKSFDFENDIVTRMASLGGLGSGINVDAFGLPVAPTFAPQDHQGSKNNKKVTKGMGTGRAGYTDEDQKTWCIVCLDDATIKCIGCDNDVFCGRCWRDMHVGPSAGYDERGHQWVKFVR